MVASKLHKTGPVFTQKWMKTTYAGALPPQYQAIVTAADMQDDDSHSIAKYATTINAAAVNRMLMQSAEADRATSEGHPMSAHAYQAVIELRLRAAMTRLSASCIDLTHLHTTQLPNQQSGLETLACRLTWQKGFCKLWRTTTSENILWTITRHMQPQAHASNDAQGKDCHLLAHYSAPAKAPVSHNEHAGIVARWGGVHHVAAAPSPGLDALTRYAW